ncbi:lipid asymmetry maintenance protein MlaB [Pseudoalteromonas mariniglutinosa]|uniref:STAS domain-containing protein n=1 Tax=Pseudoalteromonas mariniglutinosa TaxID=206042 RepID=UPI00384E8467
MAVSVSKKADYIVVECQSECNIFYVHELYQSLQAVIDEKPAKVIVDLSQVEDVDTAGIQLLLWFKQQLAATCELTFILGDSQTVGELLTLYQLDEKLTHSVEGNA